MVGDFHVLDVERAFKSFQMVLAITIIEQISCRYVTVEQYETVAQNFINPMQISTFKIQFVNRIQNEKNLDSR